MKLRFPLGFQWGTAMSAFQTEMGSPGESVFKGTDWYAWTHSSVIRDQNLVSQDFPEEGDDFWNRYEEDISNAVALGNNSIRLSIEWARIFPDSTRHLKCRVKRNSSRGTIDVILNEEQRKDLDRHASEPAVRHYRQILGFARKSGLSVFLTLYHWPLPVWLHDPVGAHLSEGVSGPTGWLDAGAVVEFGKYADFASRAFGDLVDQWETINEPEVIATQGYFFGETAGFPPGLNDPIKTFQVGKNLAYAHAVAYRNIKRNRPETPVGVGTAPQYICAGVDNAQSRRAAEYASYLNNEWFLNAIVMGRFDHDLDMVCDEIAEGLPGADFLGIDYYQRVRISRPESAPVEDTLDFEIMPCLDCSDFNWDIYPEGIREVAKWVFQKYRLPIYILENGIADASDRKRGKFIHDHLAQLAKAIREDGVPVKGYFHWSLIDNFEWAKGFSMRFGLYEVDYATKKRTRRNSAFVYENICRSGEIEIND